VADGQLGSAKTAAPSRFSSNQVLQVLAHFLRRLVGLVGIGQGRQDFLLEGGVRRAFEGAHGPEEALLIAGFVEQQSADRKGGVSASRWS
jgi:hypothetical protein